MSGNTINQSAQQEIFDSMLNGDFILTLVILNPSREKFFSKRVFVSAMYNSTENSPFLRNRFFQEEVLYPYERPNQINEDIDGLRALNLLYLDNNEYRITRKEQYRITSEGKEYCQRELFSGKIYGEDFLDKLRPLASDFWRYDMQNNPCQ